MKNIEIQIPEGYEIDEEKSTFTNIVFKEIKKQKPEWEDFGMVTGYFISGYCSAVSYSGISHKENKNTYPTLEEAKASIALTQLLQWRDKYNEGWKRDYKLKWDYRYIIRFVNEEIEILNSCYRNVLCFKNKQIAEKFKEDFEDLIIQAKELL